MAERKTGMIVTLPMLPKLHMLPRRYEETKPSVIQNFTHRRILEIGNEIQRKYQTTFEHDKHMAVEEAKHALWVEADRLREVALKQSKGNIHDTFNQKLIKMAKKHEDDLKAEAVRNEAAAKKETLDLIKHERYAGDKRLKDAVRLTEEYWKEEIEKAVNKAREEEREKAGKQANDIVMVKQEELAAALKQAEVEKVSALEELSNLKDLEKEDAITIACKQERDVAQVQHVQQRLFYEREYQKIQTELNTVREEMNQVQKIAKNVMKARMKIEEDLKETRLAYQNFVLLKTGYTGKYEDFMMPPFYPDEL